MDDVKREIYAASALRPFVIVSFETCDYCDAAFLSAIVEAKRWLGNRLQIVIASDHVAQKIVSLLGWTDALRPRATLAETLLSCASRG